MSLPDDRDQSEKDVVAGEFGRPPTGPPVVLPEPEPQPTTSAPIPNVPVVQTQDPEEEKGGKIKAVAVAAGAAALANKVRQEAPKKVQEIRQKRAAGRWLILTEVDGRQVAIGPYRDENAARQDTVKVAGLHHLVELLPQGTYFQASQEN